MGKRKSHTEGDWVNWVVVPGRWCFSRLGTAGCSRYCERVYIVVKPPQFILTQPSKNMPKYLLVDTLNDCLDLWQELPVDNVPYIEECGQLNFDSLTCLVFFGDVENLHWLLWFLVFRLHSKIHVSSPVTILRSKSGEVCRNLFMSWHTCM